MLALCGGWVRPIRGSTICGILLVSCCSAARADPPSSAFFLNDPSPNWIYRNTDGVARSSPTIDPNHRSSSLSRWVARSRLRGRRFATAGRPEMASGSGSARRSCRCGPADQKSGCAVAGALPAWRLDRRFPGGADGLAGQGRPQLVACGGVPADGRVARRVRALAEARSVGAAICVRVGRWRLPAGPHGRPHTPRHARPFANSPRKLAQS
jgi:hypothetical protein